MFFFAFGFLVGESVAAASSGRIEGFCVLPESFVGKARLVFGQQFHPVSVSCRLRFFLLANE